MIKNNTNRLLHVFLPFIVMVMVQRLLILIFGYLDIAEEVAEILAFIPASACGIALFFLIWFPVEEEEDPVPPLVKIGFGESLCWCITMAGVLVVAMYMVSGFFEKNAVRSAEFSALSVVSLGILHPVLEELIFRKLFYGELRKMNRFFGVVAQAVMFAIVHNSVDGMVYALLSGALLAILVETTGSLWTSVAVHIFVNMRSLLCLTVLANHINLANIADMLLCAVAFVALICSLIIRRRSRMTAINKAEDEE